MCDRHTLSSVDDTDLNRRDSTHRPEPAPLFLPPATDIPESLAQATAQSYPQQTALWITLWRGCGTRRNAVWRTVDEPVDKVACEHTFDHLTWGFLLHTVCGKVGFKYSLKVPI